MLSTKFGYGRPAFLAAAFAAVFFAGVKAFGLPMDLGRFLSHTSFVIAVALFVGAVVIMR